jgi:hypothetical protein
MQRALFISVLLLAGCNAQPSKTHAQIDDFIKLTDKTLGVVQKVNDGTPAAEVGAAFQELSNAFKATNPQLEASLGRISRFSRPGVPSTLDPAEIAGCVEASTVAATSIGPTLGASSASFKQAPPELRASMLNSAAQCVARLDVYLSDLSNRRSADDAGFAMVVLYPAEITILATVLLSEGPDPEFFRAYLKNYHAANETIIAKLAPSCRERKVAQVGAQVIEVHYECVAYNGDKAEAVETYQQGRLITKPIDRKSVENQATRLTSRGVAVGVQQNIEALMRKLAEKRA